MISTKGLQVGNWIQYDSEGTFFQVSEIGATGLGVKNDEEETWIELDQFSPIPLEPEILLRSGFEKGLVQSYFRIYPFYNGRLTLHVHEEYNEIQYVQQGLVIVEVKTVHQLQNLYHALTDKELEIKIT